MRQFPDFIPLPFIPLLISPPPAPLRSGRRNAAAGGICKVKRGSGAVGGPETVCDGHRIIPLLRRLRIRDRKSGIGRARNIREDDTRYLKHPLVEQWRGAGGGYAESRRAADHDVLARGFGDDCRRASDNIGHC